MDRRTAVFSLFGAAAGVLVPKLARAATTGRQLIARYPGLRALPWLELAHFPTPIEEAPELARVLGVGRLFVKRDDRAGTVYGGSKVRKLELLLADAEARGFRSVAALGGVGSNQTLATAFFAKQRGLSARLLLLPERPSAEVRAHLLAQAALGAEQRLVGSEAAARAVIARFAERPYVIPMGGSSPLGNAGFVEAGLELAAQVLQGLLPAPDLVYLPLGTGGSAVGLSIGLAAAGLATSVVAVRAASQRFGSPAELRRTARATSRLLHDADPGFPIGDRLARLELRDGWVGKGYAEPTASGRRARELARAHAGLELDLTYSAKTLAGLIGDAGALSDKTVVFWLTYDARRVDPGNVVPDRVPPELRGYARGPAG